MDGGNSEWAEGQAGLSSIRAQLQTGDVMLIDGDDGSDGDDDGDNGGGW